jgi:hypothetical protein
MSWADANINNDPIEQLSHRITDLEQMILTQVTELRTEVGLAAAAIRGGGGAAGPAGTTSMLGDLEEQLAHAVTVSLSAALEAIRQSLTEAVTDAVAQLAFRLETTLASSPSATAARPQLSGSDLDDVATTLQHSVLLALSAFETSHFTSPEVDPTDPPATARDVNRVNQRIDELRSLLLG